LFLKATPTVFGFLIYITFLSNLSRLANRVLVLTVQDDRHFLLKI